MANKDGDGWRTALKTLSQVGQIGFTFAFSVLISVGIGYWLDKLAGTDRLFKLIFLVIGLFSGALSVYKSLSRFLQDE
ncbi:AtpZ/AtpI family protein [Candidatus Bipolaricaulota bacterium]|nr:AtpZ/AtpI family protein [Candidatus Bipolaricaulota bacterium]